MIDFEIFYVAAYNLLKQPLRSALTLIGIVIGIAAIVALITLGQGLQLAVTSMFEEMGLNTIFVEPGTSMMSAVFGNTIRESDIGLIEDIPGVDAVIPFYETSATLKYKGEEEGAFIIGYDPADSGFMEEIGYLDMVEGRQLTSADKYAVVIGDTFAERAFDNKVSIREKLEMKGKKFRVIGTFSEDGMFVGGMNIGGIVYMTDDGFKELFGVEDPFELVVKVGSKASVPEVAERIEKALEDDHGEKDTQILTSEQLIEGAGIILGIIQLVLVGIAAISLLVGGIGIMNTMMMSVVERTTEIGTMKAIGATNKTILSLFLIEAGVVGLAGGGIGVALGLGAAVFVSAIAKSAGFDLPTDFSLPLIAGAMLFSMGVGMVSGILPAKRAAGLDPVDALREGKG